MNKKHYRWDFKHFVRIENDKIEHAPPSFYTKFERFSFEGYGDWGLYIKNQERPLEISELTLDNVGQFYRIRDDPVVFENLPVQEFFDWINFSANFRLEIANKKHIISHEEPWDEVAHILNNFKRMGLTLDQARELADNVGKYWDDYQTQKSNEYFRYFIPGEMTVIPKAIILCRCGNCTTIMFENQHNQIVELDFGSS